MSLPDSSERILGIDPGIGITGWSIINTHRNKPILHAAGIISTTPNSRTEKRLLTIYSEITRLFETYKPQSISVEKLFFARNVTTAMTVSQARGVVLLVAEQNHIPIHEYTPLQIKMAITGYGRATKKQIIEMLAHHIQGAAVPKQDDAADAVAVAVTHSIVRR